MVIVHYWVRTRGARGETLLDGAPAVRWEALISWVLASLASRFTDVLFTDALEGLAYGAAIYLVLATAVDAISGRRSGDTAVTEEDRAARSSGAS